MLKKSLFIVSFTLCMPLVSFAASCSTLSNDTFAEIVNWAICTINQSIIPFIFVLATLVFLIGVLRFVANGADEEARKKGKDFMIWGIIAMAVMVSIWGLVRLITGSLHLDNDSEIRIPESPTYMP